MRAFVTILGISTFLAACSTDDFTAIDDASAPDVVKNEAAVVDVAVDVATDAAVEAQADVVDAGFTPASLSGLVLWLDSAKRDGNDIWTDQANPPHVLASSGEVPAAPTKPTYQPTGGPKGLPAMSFDGVVPNMVAFSDRADFHPRADADVVFALVVSLAPDSGPQQRYMAVQFQKAGGPNDGFGLEVTANKADVRLGGGLAPWGTAPPVVSDSNFHVVTMFRSAGATQLRLAVDGTVTTASLGPPDIDASVPARGPFTVGDAIVFGGSAMSLGGGPITGKIAELLMFTANPPATLGLQTHVAPVTTYLKAKYGL